MCVTSFLIWGILDGSLRASTFKAAICSAVTPGLSFQRTMEELLIKQYRQIRGTANIQPIWQTVMVVKDQLREWDLVLDGVPTSG